MTNILQNIHAFTSITANYLPKARVLAESIKVLYPDVVFSVMLSDNTPAGFDLENEPFDHLITINDLNLIDRDAWVFSHSVVELCTAVKGFAFQHIMDQTGAEKVFYFDPDIAVFGRLEDLTHYLDQNAAILTPHQIEPDSDYDSIADNEIASLKHGVFNLGFLGVRNDASGRAVIDWWAERLRLFCFDDIPSGLFTDQRWMDLAPCFFDDIKVIRDPGFNVATWNLSRRIVTSSHEQEIRINDAPLGFYHFSGLDSGDNLIMLNKYAKGNSPLRELRDWYIKRCEHFGQSQLGNQPGCFDLYSDGSRITREERRFYRDRKDVQKRFPNPFDVSNINESYRDWYRANVGIPVGLKMVSIPSGASMRVVLNDVATYIRDRSETANHSGWLKRQIGKLIASLLALVAGRLS